MCDARYLRGPSGELKIDQHQLVVARFMRAIQLDHPDKPGDDTVWRPLQVGLCSSRSRLATKGGEGAWIPGKRVRVVCGPGAR